MIQYWWIVYVPRNFTIPSSLPNVWANSYSSSSLVILCISEVSIVIAPLSFLIFVISIIYILLLVNLADGLSILFAFLKKLSFDFFYTFSLLYFTYFCSNFCYCLLSANFGLTLFLF